MKFDQLVEQLLEGTSPLRTMYHITKMANAVNIINHDGFVLSVQDTTGDILYGSRYQYYMSCARTLTSAYIRDMLKDYHFTVILELDISKLSDKGYVIKPIHDFKNLNPFGDRDYVVPEKQESEDRILSNKQIIPNAKSFIKTINLLHPIGLADTASQVTTQNFPIRYTIQEALKVFKDSGIPTYVYKEHRFFQRLDKRKAKLLE